MFIIPWKPHPVNARTKRRVFHAQNGDFSIVGVEMNQFQENRLYGTAAQFGGASGEVFSAICGMQIPRFTSSKPSKFAFASDEKSIRRTTTSFVRRCHSVPI